MSASAARPVRIGLLGASWIGEHAIVQPARGRSDAVVSAVAARDSARAERYAQIHGIPAIAADYEALIARDDVDVVFVGLTPSEHMHWTIRALEAGKHVLCEKPFAMNAVQAERMVTTAATHRRLLLEAWHYRFHGLMKRMESIVASGMLGALHRAQATFVAPIPPAPEAFRWQAALGGGALLDTGGYTVHVLRTLLKQEPVVLRATSAMSQGVDVRTRAVLGFDDGLQADIECGMTGDELYSRLRLEGTSGTLTVLGFPLPQMGCQLTLERAGTTVVETSFPGTTYEAQLDHLVKCVGGTVPLLTGGMDAVANMRVLDAIRAKAQRIPAESPGSSIHP